MRGTGVAGCEGRRWRGHTHPCQRCTHHLWSMSACKDALSLGIPRWHVSLSRGLSRFYQRISKHHRVCILPLGTPVYIPEPFSAVCDNMPDFTPEQLRLWHTALSASCRGWRLHGEAFVSQHCASESRVHPNPQAAIPVFTSWVC